MLFVYTVSVWLFSNACVLIAHKGQYVDYSRPPHPASHFLWEWGTRLCLSTACRAHTCKRGFKLALLHLLQHTCDIRRGAKNHNCSTLTSTTHAASSHFISAFEQLKKENASLQKWVRNLPHGGSQLFTASHVPYEYKQNSSVFHKDKDKSSFTCCTSSWCKRRKIRITSLATVSKPSSLGFVFVFAALPPYPLHRMWCHYTFCKEMQKLQGSLDERSVAWSRQNLLSFICWLIFFFCLTVT